MGESRATSDSRYARTRGCSMHSAGAIMVMRPSRRERIWLLKTYVDGCIERDVGVARDDDVHRTEALPDFGEHALLIDEGALVAEQQVAMTDGNHVVVKHAGV